MDKQGRSWSELAAAEFKFSPTIQLWYFFLEH